MGKLRDFSEIYAIAAARKGGPEALEAILAETASLSPGEIAGLGDDRLLSKMTRRIFQAGLSHVVIDRKWPGFEEAFRGFDIGFCAFLSDDQIHELSQDERIVRNAAKIRAVQKNAVFLQELAAEHGSAATFIAAWPDADYIGLLELLKKRASYMGGDSAMRFLRAIGKPAFVTSPDVVTALVREGVVEKAPSSKKDMQAVQAAFNSWAAASGRDLTALSRVLSMSVGAMPGDGMPWNDDTH